jgi:phage terminase small subunit
MSTVAKPGPGKRRGRPSGKVTDKQARFIAEYVTDLNGTRAATAAGYRHPAVAASKLLNPHLYPFVVKAVEKALAEKRAACNVEARDLIAALLPIAFCDPRQLVHRETGEWLAWQELPGSVCLAIKHYQIVESRAGEGRADSCRTFRVQFHDKLKAMRLLLLLLGCLRPAPPAPEADVRT